MIKSICSALILCFMSSTSYAKPLEKIECNYAAPFGITGKLQLQEQAEGLVVQFYKSGTQQSYTMQILETDEHFVKATYDMEADFPVPAQTIEISIRKLSLYVDYNSSVPSFNLDIQDCHLL